MTLMNSERVLSRMTTGHGELVLTTHRVVHGWQNSFTTIRLPDVGSAIVARLTHRWMLVVTGTCIMMAACLVARALLHGEFESVDIYRQGASALLFISAFLVVTFGVKRMSVVQIFSPQATISFRVRSAIRRDVNRFLIELDKARIVWYYADKNHGSAPAAAETAPLQRRAG